MTLLDPLFTTEEMQSIFSDRARLQGMLDFEAALARAQARTGVIPPATAATIQAHCHAARFNAGALARAAASAGNLAIPLINELTAQVGRDDEEAMRYVHWGATSQDAIDTGTVLQLREALSLIGRRVTRLADALARLAESYKTTLLAGRTWLQQGPPVTFGLKAAGWLSAIERDRSRLRALPSRVLVLQFGGATGTLATLGPRALQAAEALAEELQLGLPDLPWHAHRDRFAEVATVLGLLGGTLGKIARDVALLMQTEVGEAAEPH
ncbi:MAG: lyase family protein, partial [Sulfurifustaceae bacterium]